ncbi:MAG: DbpA RNA binding domain-containing protein, partial [Thiohalomonadales bacterium]
SLYMDSEQYKLDALLESHNNPLTIEKTTSLKRRENFRLSPNMVSLCINGGRKDKIRAGDVLGALTANTSLPAKQIGKINIADKISYVAVERPIAKQALRILSEGKIKGRKFRVRKLR